ncbi:MAG: hypothetical protein ACTHU0_34410 [Kofleriaceae bacterium]
MTRRTKNLWLCCALGLAALSGACNKPSEDSCRKAIENMRSLLGTESLQSTEATAGEIRRCKGGSKKAAVECAINATSIEQLRDCKFMKVPDKQPEPAGGATGTGSGAGTGSGTGSEK